MNAKKLLLKFAVLALGLTALHMEAANPAKAAPVFCQVQFCSTATAGGRCGTVGADCNVCHGSDGSTGPCGLQ
jgi:cytochrome c5